MVEAVRAELEAAQAAGTFGTLSWFPVRSYADWDLDLATADYEKIYVDVVLVSNGITIERETQTGVRYTVPVDIGIRKKLGPADEALGVTPDRSVLDNAVIDSLVDLTEHIAEYFPTPSGRLATYTNAVVEGSPDVRTVAGRDHLRNRQFTGVVRVTHRVDKELTP